MASLDKVLSLLPARIPESFRSDAEEAARLVGELERGEPSAAAQKLKDIIRCSSFIYGDQIRYARRSGARGYWPKWISETEDKPTIPFETYGSVGTRIHELFKSRGAVTSTSTNGSYFKFDVPSPNNSIAHNKKAYIEGEELLKESLTSFLDAMRQRKHIRSMKLHDSDTLVLYWLTGFLQGQEDEIIELSHTHGIGLRGPVQDVVRIQPGEEGRADLTFTLSNDQSLGANGKNPFLWNQLTYDAEKFFAQYLRLTFFGCKRPSSPHMLSYVPVIEPKAGVERYRDEVSRLDIAGLPAVTVIMDRKPVDVFNKESVNKYVREVIQL